ncbi:TetR/AcrR family transcriptional regulator [Krasilnikovia sp. MM14-A1259]|uniref:TetR/AcrR family transcriptional regulator n=1 Tax=Krasilnikovia sp. MM14-A1259 TaxID=3373539 RepID=UPI003813194C
MADRPHAVPARDPGLPTAGLPIAGQPVLERADAARNRRRMLGAAARIIATDGVKALTLDEVAKAAGVGTGTAYRRFGDRAGLIFALLDEEELQFQTAFMCGPAPLGPGAPAPERIRAFLHALVDRIASQLEMLLAAETSSARARFRSGPYTIYHTHLATLVAQACPGVDQHFVAAALLAPVSATQLSYQIEDRGLATDVIKSGLDDLLHLNL